MQQKFRMGMRMLQYPPKFTQIVIFWLENIPSGNPAGNKNEEIGNEGYVC
jgi:hypothetical protein